MPATERSSVDVIHPSVCAVHAPRSAHTRAPIERKKKKKKHQRVRAVLPNVYQTYTDSSSSQTKVCTVLQSSEHTPHTNRRRDPRVHRRAVTRRRDRPRRRRSSHDDDFDLDDEMSDLNPVWKAVKPYMNGGLSGMGATCVIQPLDSA